eukprot:COSAG05_NODE_955_length_6434_cov_15.147119_4_plen_111_part_00
MNSGPVLPANPTHNPVMSIYHSCIMRAIRKSYGKSNANMNAGLALHGHQKNAGQAGTVIGDNQRRGLVGPGATAVGLEALQLILCVRELRDQLIRCAMIVVCIRRRTQHA